MRQAEGFVGEENLAKALAGADLVVIPAGVPRKPGMTRDDLFNINAGIVKNLTKAIAQHAPNVSGACIPIPWDRVPALLSAGCTAMISPSGLMDVLAAALLI